MTQPPRRRAVLIVEDDTDTADMLATYLEGEGFRAFTSSDGWQAAIQAEGLKLDLIVTDVMMPGPQGTGLDAYNKIRSSYGARRDIPIIVLTAVPKEKVVAAFPKDDPRLRILAKPVDFKALKHAIKELLS